MGANKRYDNVKVQGLGRTMIHGKFRPNGATGIVSGSPTGQGWSAARTSAGLYTITFDDKYAELVSAAGWCRAADATPTLVQAGDWSASNKTLQLRLLQGSTGTVGATGTVPLDIGTIREIVSNEIASMTDTEDTTTYTSGGMLAADTSPAINRVNAGTDKALRIEWAAGDTTELQFSPFIKPADLDSGTDLTIHLMLAKNTNTDTTATVDVQVFDGVGDTEMGGATAALATADLTEYSVTIANANVAAAPGFINVGLVPSAHAADEIYCYGAWVEYTKADAGMTWALTDLAADADAEILFEAIFRNTSIDY